MLGWMKQKVESRMPGEISITSDDTTLKAESEGELRSILMKVKEESEKVGLKLNIRSWHLVHDLIFLGSKITVDGDCSHEIKRLLLLGRKSMTNLDSILKCRYISLPTNVLLVKALFLPVVMYECES